MFLTTWRGLKQAVQLRQHSNMICRDLCSSAFIEQSRLHPTTTQPEVSFAAEPVLENRSASAASSSSSGSLPSPLTAAWRLLSGGSQSPVFFGNDVLSSKISAVLAESGSHSPSYDIGIPGLWMPGVSPISVPEGSDGATPDEVLECATKRTYQPSVLIRKRRHGFLSRMETKDGRNVIKRRKFKGRWKITA